jgi:fucose permease
MLIQTTFGTQSQISALIFKKFHGYASFAIVSRSLIEKLSFQAGADATCKLHI